MYTLQTLTEEDLHLSEEIESVRVCNEKIGIKSTEQSPQYTAYMSDRRYWKNLSGSSNIIRGTYSNITWLMRRPTGTYICGYINPDFEITEDIYSELEYLVHGGFTARFGFDTRHAYDWAYCSFHDSPGLVYRDFQYCLDDILAVVDKIRVHYPEDILTSN